MACDKAVEGRGAEGAEMIAAFIRNLPPMARKDFVYRLSSTLSTLHQEQNWRRPGMQELGPHLRKLQHTLEP